MTESLIPKIILKSPNDKQKFQMSVAVEILQNDDKMPENPLPLSADMTSDDGSHVHGFGCGCGRDHDAPYI